MELMGSISRQHILDEIKRTSRENEGAPLGWRKFRTETGIRPYDWNKYWARWADAQREAGFVPNEKQARYGEDVLIEKYIGLIRELGRFPAKSDLRIKCFNDPEFPSEKTYRRFGTKGQFAAKILTYCQHRQDYEDVSDLCAKLVGEEVAHTDAAVAAAEEIGFVYLLKSGRHYKIGKTNAVGRRERELAIQLPEKTSKIHSIKTDDPGGIEAYWHKRFERKRKHGEWFELSASDVSVFRRRKFM